MITPFAHDAHIHLTSLSRDDEHSIWDLLSTMDSEGVHRAAVVTPATMGWNNEVTLGAVDLAPERLVAVVRVDISDDASVHQLRAALERGARGLRLPMLDHPDDLLAHPQMPVIAAALQAHGAALELHAHTHQLTSVVPIARQYPELKIIIDHLGRPSPEKSPDDPNYAPFRSLAPWSNVLAKTPNSSFFSRKAAPYADLIPYINCVLDEWGSDRIMWGSDWPFCIAQEPFSNAFQPALAVLAGRTNDERHSVLLGTFESTFGP